MTWLLGQQVGTVVSIQMDDRKTFEAIRLDPHLTRSIAYYRITDFGPLTLLHPSEVDQHLALFIAIMRIAPKPVYIHCRAGVDRTGVLSEAYRVIIEGADREQAIAEMGRFRSPWQFLDARYLRELSDARREQILQEAAAQEAQLRATAHVECTHGRCTFTGD